MTIQENSAMGLPTPVGTHHKARLQLVLISPSVQQKPHPAIRAELFASLLHSSQTLASE